MLCVFDLDGVVIDSLELVKTSYRQAGIVPPDDVFEREGVDWAPPEYKMRKDAFYVRGLRDVPWAPGLLVAQQLRELGYECVCLTGAPVGTLNRLRTRLGHEWPFTSSSLDGTRTPVKMKILAGWPGGVYIDDQTRLVDVPPGWRFIHYTGQDLLKEILG